MGLDIYIGILATSLAQIQRMNWRESENTGSREWVRKFCNGARKRWAESLISAEGVSLSYVKGRLTSFIYWASMVAHS